MTEANRRLMLSAARRGAIFSIAFLIALTVKFGLIAALGKRGAMYVLIGGLVIFATWCAIMSWKRLSWYRVKRRADKIRQQRNGNGN